MTTNEPAPRRRLPWVGIAAAAGGLVLLLAVGWLVGAQLGANDKAQQTSNSGVTLEQVQAWASSQAALAKCADLYRDGQIIDDAKARAGCLDPDGTAHYGGWRRCNDGRHLINVDPDSGAPRGYGFGGDVFHATTKSDLSDDPGFGKAYAACNG